VEWLPVIQNRLGVSLSPTKIYEYPTLRELAAFVFSQMPKATPNADPSTPKRHEPQSLTMDDWLQAVYDGTADLADAQRWMTMPDAPPATVVHAR
jgi:hypothetical protein